jgi:thiol-disulfide isomerase/thioredoxin
LLAILVMIVATRLRLLVQAGWAGAVLGPQYAIRLVIQLLTQTLTIDLGILVIAAVVIWALAGPRRQLGRSFDLACVAVLPLVVIDLVAGVVVHALDVAVPMPVTWILTAAAYSWTGSLVALAMIEVRRRSLPAAGGKLAGWMLAAVAATGVALQIVWVTQHPDLVRPMTTGDRAPGFALPAIGPGGQLAGKVTLAPGKVAVVDFWATWCGPCLKSLPHLDAFARAHPEVAVYAISIDDGPQQPRALFDQKGYSPILLLDDHETSERWGVTTIPHTVLIDRAGNVRKISRGGGLDLEAELRQLQ